jgi:phage-related protein
MTKKHNLQWVGSSRDDLKEFPNDVREEMGYALYLAQCGEKSPDAKPMKGFLGAGVLEIVENFNTDTYRAIYTVRFKGTVYVLHAFQKKSKSGIATSRKDIDLIHRRLKAAEEHHKGFYEKEKKNG